MFAQNRTAVSSVKGPRPHGTRTGFIRALLLLAVVGLLGSALYVGSSASSLHNTKGISATSSSRRSPAAVSSKTSVARSSGYSSFSPPAPLAATLASYASDCTTPKTSFAVGDTVCLGVSGIPVSAFFPHRLFVGNANTTIIQSFDVTSDPQTFSFTADATTTINGIPYDNRGTWRAVVINPFFFFPEATTSFVVTDPANATADLAVDTVQSTGSVGAGSQSIYVLQVTNYGPDSATNVTLSDAVPANTTFVSFDQSGSPTFTCTNPTAGETGTSTCTIATLASGATATFIATYDVNTGTAAGTQITNTATVASVAPPTPATDDERPQNNSTTATTAVVGGGGGGTCILNCPDNMNAVANTTEGGQRGTHVTFDPADASGTCGAVTASPSSGSFFPVGTTVVSVTSETGGGSCSFTITVEDTGSNPPNITCPADPAPADADSNCVANVTVGTATATGDNVTIFATRNDGLAMYTCDANGTNCTRNSSDSPFPAGVTTITWIAHSHDTPGPYASEDDEIAHRTGAASCTERVTVNDVTPPTITPPANQTASADASCMFTIPDYTSQASVSDNCACDSNTENCQGRVTITVSQSPAPGTQVGLGTTTITLTANDGSSNNNGAGNTATANFTVTVNDTTAPTFTFVPPTVVAFTGPGATTCDTVVSNATLGTATATDNCSTPTITRSPSGNTFPVGNTTVVWTATDAAGNHSSANQTVTVIDNTPPQISCQADIVADYDPAVNGATVTYTTPVGTDNCASTTAQTAGLPSGSVFPPGNTTNTFTVTDASGNTASCSFKVTVAVTSVIGMDSATLSGAVTVDSYNSTGGYPATKGSLANLLSNGTISDLGSSKMFGNVRSTRVGVSVQGTSQVNGNATAGTTVSKGASAVITGTITNNALAPVMTLPSVVPCSPFSSSAGISGTFTYNSSTGDLTVNGINIATLANGNYCFHNVTLGNSGQLKVNGPVVMKLTGSLSTSGASNLNNTTQIPSNLRILSSLSGGTGITFGNGTSVYLLIYAPTTGVNDSGSAPVFGEIVGKSLTISNSGALHYDTTLKNAWPALWPLILAP